MTWGKFDKRSKQRYIATDEEHDLVPNVDSSYFVHDIYSDDDKLKQIFESNEFQQKTNVRKFNAISLGNLLKYEIPLGRKIPNWNPESTDIPNKIWLNKIWKFILESNVSLEVFLHYPLLEVIRPTKELTFLDSRHPLMELPKDDTHYEELIQILEALGIRFTNHPWDEKLNDYIYKWTPKEVLKSIHYAEQNGKTFDVLNDKSKIKALRNFIVENWNRFSSSDGTI
ncbi:12421_t:CDS:1, partial [Racocetra fulgida]